MNQDSFWWALVGVAAGAAIVSHPAVLGAIGTVALWFGLMVAGGAAFWLVCAGVLRLAESRALVVMASVACAVLAIPALFAAGSVLWRLVG